MAQDGPKMPPRWPQGGARRAQGCIEMAHDGLRYHVFGVISAWLTLKNVKKPGKTNYLQYVNIPQIGVSVVDCPGYGHANKSTKEIKNWGKMLEEYISNGK